MVYSAGVQLRFQKSVDEYLANKINILRTEAVMVDELSVALTAGERENALRLLLEGLPRPELVSPLLPLIMDAVIDSSRIPTIEFARRILRHYKDEPLVRDATHTSVAAYLAENDEWHYRRIAELLEELGYEEELASFLLVCQVSVNLEIQEIAQDWS